MYDDEIRCFVLHIPFKYHTMICTHEVAEILEKYDGAPLRMSVDPMLYVVTIVFGNEEQRNGAAVELSKIGINSKIEMTSTYVKRRDAKPSWLKD